MSTDNAIDRLISECNLAASILENTGSETGVNVLREAAKMIEALQAFRETALSTVKVLSNENAAMFERVQQLVSEQDEVYNWIVQLSPKVKALEEENSQLKIQLSEKNS